MPDKDRITINRPVVTRSFHSSHRHHPATRKVEVHLQLEPWYRFDKSYGQPIMAYLCKCRRSGSLAVVFVITVTYLTFLPVIWLGIIAETIKTRCPKNKFKFLSILLAELSLLICLAILTKLTLILSSAIGLIATFAQPTLSLITSSWEILEKRLTRLEELVEKNAVPIFGDFVQTESASLFEWLGELSHQDEPDLEGNFLPPTIAPSSTSPPHLPSMLPLPMPKLTPPPPISEQPGKIPLPPPQPTATQGPVFDSEGWLLVCNGTIDDPLPLKASTTETLAL